MEAGEVAVQAGFGIYRSSSAFAVGLKARLNERSSLSIGGTFDGYSAMGGVGYATTIK